MGKHENEPQQSQVYEAILPEWRFKELAQMALMKQADQVERKANAVEATWPKQPGDDRYKIQWRQDFNPWVGGAISTYTLEHYVNGISANQPTTRYRVTETQNGIISQIKVYGEKDQEMKLNKNERRVATSKALRILSDVDPDSAKLVFDRAVDHQYALTIGTYVLSEMALEGADNDLNIGAVWQAVGNHEDLVDTIENEELKRAKRRRAKRYPQPFYYETVQEAVETRRTPNSVDRYANIDLLAITDAVAERMNRKWRHIIPLDETDEPGAKAEPDEPPVQSEPITEAFSIFAEDTTDDSGVIVNLDEPETDDNA